MKFILPLLAISGVGAVSFSAWDGLSCRGAKRATRKGTAAFRCYYIGSSASIKAFGLGEHGKSKYRLFSDPKCKKKVGDLKYNNLCADYNFLSVALLVPLDQKEQNITLPEPGSEDWAVRQILLARDGYPLENDTQLASNEKRGKPLQSHPKAVDRRNTGDRYNADFHHLSGLDEQDHNTGDTSNFDFPNRDEEFMWAAITLDRLQDRERRGALVEYRGNQRVNGRELQIDLRADSGTLNEIGQDDIAKCLNLFLHHRTHAGNNRWQFYRRGVQLFTLTFKALR